MTDIEIEAGRFTVGVFQDVAWASRGLDALKREGFPAESITVISKSAPEVAALVDRALGVAGGEVDLPTVGSVLARGPLVEALQGPSRDLPKLGLSGTLRRVGFQAHDGRIFEALVARGGVLVAIRSEPRAADALRVLHSYGGGNAAIGAWLGRV